MNALISLSISGVVLFVLETPLHAQQKWNSGVGSCERGVGLEIYSRQTLNPMVGCESSSRAIATSLVLEIGEEPKEDCDSDTDGALIGTLAGGLGGYLIGGALTNFKCADGACYAPVFGLAGAIAGFWGGLAHDSKTCDPP